jgi:dCMP deaminase
MSLAYMLARRSTCERLAVGCVITSMDYRQVLAVGYNGNASHLPNGCDRTGPEGVGNCGCLHAEENAVINCNALRSAEKVVFCTNLPCPACAKRIIQLGGVDRVFFHQDYRVRTGVDLLSRVGIVVAQFEDEVMGQLAEWPLRTELREDR